jgi:hypothetical protein
MPRTGNQIGSDLKGKGSVDMTGDKVFRYIKRPAVQMVTGNWKKVS